VSQYSFLRADSSFPLPRSFNFRDYIDTERELWALFPETEGKRVNFVQVGLTAVIFAGVHDDGAELDADETFILMPCPDQTLRPIRMKACRRLTLSEYRMGHLTAIKLAGKLNLASDVMQQIGSLILGAEVLEEAEARMRQDE
jgi:hypothetical protein